jgi:Superinfection immunity protein
MPTVGTDQETPARREPGVHVPYSVLSVAVLCDIAVTFGALYLLPVLIGLVRGTPDLASVAVVNVLLGWTLFGWVIALVMALRCARVCGVDVPAASSLHDHGSSATAGRSRTGYAELAPRRAGCPPPLPLPKSAPGAR